jgi:nucleoside-diphosphate-sugar epimerase
MVMTDGNGRLALVVGAAGSEVAGALLRHGWQVRGLARRPGAASKPARADLAGMTWVVGDALDRRSVVEAARGAALIVHAVNPPGYRNWATLVMPMLESSIAAALSAGARIVLPGTVYNFGPDAFPNPAEDAPQHPRTRKGVIRVRMEQRLREAAREGVRTLVVRAGDFFGPHAGNNWFSQGLVKPGRPPSSISDPGRRGLGHQWAYLPDVAETMARLADREKTLAAFEIVHMDGHWDGDGSQMIRAIRAAVGDPALPVRAFPWWLVTLAAPVIPLFRELREMRYLWRMPLRMSNKHLLEVLGSEPHTPLAAAVRSTLAGLGCLPGGDAAAAASAA